MKQTYVTVTINVTIITVPHCASKNDIDLAWYTVFLACVN